MFLANLIEKWDITYYNFDEGSSILKDAMIKYDNKLVIMTYIGSH